MNKIKKKDLVITMIKDDLTNWKMIYAFNQLGFQADDYALYAGSTILKVIGIKSKGLKWEAIHEEYLEKTLKIQQIDILESPRLLHALAEEIYDFLKKKRKEERALIRKKRLI